MWFPMRHEPPEFVGPWTFQSVNHLPGQTVKDVFAIVKSDSAWQHWHPEVTNIQWEGDLRGVGASRTVVIRDWLFMLLLAGPVTLKEEFDVWNETNRMCNFGFCVTASNRPVCLTYRALREEYKVEADGDGAKFTRIVTIDPSFAVQYLLGFLIHPYLKNLFESECPKRFEKHFGKKSK